MKTTLLNIGCLDNKYLDKYIQLILTNKATESIQYKTQKHHIIPRAYYKLQNIAIDNSENNIVNLSYFDHILAHYYLALCTTDELQLKMAHAFCYLIRRTDIVRKNNAIFAKIAYTVEEQALIESLPGLCNLKYLSNLHESLRLKNGKWCNDGMKQKIIPEDEVIDFLATNEDWQLGMLPLTDAAKLKMLEAAKSRANTQNTGRRRLTNGVEEKLVLPDELPMYFSQGWYLGRAPKNCLPVTQETKEKLRAANLNKIPWNKGLSKDTDSRVAQYLENNSSLWTAGHQPWNKGKCFSESAKQKMSEAAKKRGATTARAILWVEKNIIYPSVKAAVEDVELGLKRHKIFDILSGRIAIEGKTLQYYNDKNKDE